MRPLGTTGRFERSDRLLDSRDFRRVLRRGRRRAHADLVVVTARREYDSQGESSEPVAGAPDSLRPRLGITTSRKVGVAVARNRFRRRVREWFRTHRDLIPRGTDVVVIARRSGAGLSLDQLDRRLRELLDLPPDEAAAMGARQGASR